MRVFVAVFAVALVASAVAFAATESVSGTASYGKPLTKSFTTVTAGSVSVNASWVPKSNSRYVLTVRHLTNAADPSSYDQFCQAYETQSGLYVVDRIGASGSYVPGSAVCTFSSGAAGFWTAEFLPISGKVSVSMTVSTG